MPAQPPAPGHPFLVLERLQALTDSAAALQSTLDAIVPSFQADLQRLEHDVFAHDYKAVGDQLHAMKGYVPLMCTPALAQELSQLQALLQSPAPLANTASLRPALEALLHNLKALLDELQHASRPT